MVGTNNAALASVCTEARLAHLTQDIPTMVGTNNAFLATDGANLPNDADIGDLPWDEAIAGHIDIGKMGYLLNAAWGNSADNKSTLENATHGLSALNTKILNIVNKDATPYPKVYPCLAAGNTITAPAANPWTYGNWADLVPVNTITETFWIYGIKLRQPILADNAVYELGSGATPTPFAEFTHNDQYDQAVLTIPIPIKIPANTRIQMRYAHSTFGADTKYVKLLYMTGL